VWALEREEIMEFICQIETSDARAWLVEVMKGLKHEELTRVVCTTAGVAREPIPELVFDS
jgi:hypothetical protein